MADKQKLTGWNGIEKKIFIPATAVMAVFGVIFFLYPKQSNELLNTVHDFTTNQLGWFFLAFAVLSLGLCLYFAFSPMGNILLGDRGDKPAFSTGTWLGMIFTSCTGGSLLYLSSIEWIWMADSPPTGMVARSPEAYEWASACGIFYWGPTAWAIYLVVAVPIAYFFFVKKKGSMKMSEFARPLLGKRSDGLAGNTLNFLYVFGLLGGVLTSTSLGLAPITSGIAYFLGLESSNFIIDLTVIIVWNIVPIVVLMSGLKKAASKLSNFNVICFFILFAIVLVFGPTWFILNHASDSLGTMLQNFFTMSFATDAIGKSGFYQSWTVFYMSWWVVFALPTAAFLAKISKGRTIRSFILGVTGAGSLGCFVFYAIFPGAGMDLQLSGQVDLFSVLAEKGRGGVVVELFRNFPGGKLLVAFFTIIVLVSYMTGRVSVGYSLAAGTEKRLGVDDDPQKWNMAFWLIMSGAVGFGLYMLNPEALNPLQTISIITGFPICFAMAVLVASFLKQIKQDFPDGIGVVPKEKGKIYGFADGEEPISIQK